MGNYFNSKSEAPNNVSNQNVIQTLLQTLSPNGIPSESPSGSPNGTSNVPTIDPKLFEHNPPCGSIGDCGQLGIYGNNLVCSKKGFCENCSVDTDCNGVTSPLGKCVNNVCSCLTNNDCSCEGNDPYGCGYDNKGNCVCSKENKGLAALRMPTEKGTQRTLWTLIIGFVLILLIFFINLKYNIVHENVMNKINLSIFVITIILAIVFKNTN